LSSGAGGPDASAAASPPSMSLVLVGGPSSEEEDPHATSATSATEAARNARRTASGNTRRMKAVDYRVPSWASTSAAIRLQFGFRTSVMPESRKLSGLADGDCMLRIETPVKMLNVSKDTIFWVPTTMTRRSRRRGPRSASTACAICSAMAEGIDEVLVSTMARHFPEATIEDQTLNLASDGFQITCRTGAVRPAFGVQSAQLLFAVEGGGLRGPIEVSMTHYGPTAETAVIEGACAWADSFGPVLRAGLADAATEAATFMVVQRGRRFRVYVDAFDKVLHFAPSGCEDTATARARFGLGPWLAFHVLGSGDLELAMDRPQLLSVFVGELAGKRIVEVKLDGVAYAGFDDLVTPAPPAPAKQMAALRELAVIVPD
jgi:hypothetical protein